MEKHGSEGEHNLQEKFGTINQAPIFYKNEVYKLLTSDMQSFISRQEMVFIATSDNKGECDCSFRAGSRGFIHIVNEKSLVFPEYRGNGVMASLGNITENPHIGMIFIDFFETTVGLHVNGTARVVEKNELSEIKSISKSLQENIAATTGRRPERWILIEVEEAYIHCSKYVPLLKKTEQTGEKNNKVR